MTQMGWTTDLFETDEDRAYWAGKKKKKWVVTLSWWPRGCWITQGRIKGKPKDTFTMYVSAEDAAGAARSAGRWCSEIHRVPFKQLYSDRVRLYGRRDVEEFNRAMGFKS